MQRVDYFAPVHASVMRDSTARFYCLKGRIVSTDRCNEYRASVTDANYALVNYFDLLCPVRRKAQNHSSISRKYTDANIQMIAISRAYFEKEIPLESAR